MTLKDIYTGFKIWLLSTAFMFAWCGAGFGEKSAGESGGGGRGAPWG